MKKLAVLFGFFIVVIIILADMGKLGMMRFVNAIPFGDKAGHFVLYGILTLLIDLAYIRSRSDVNPKRLVFRIAFILALLIGIEEYSQQYFPRRTFDLVDLACSYLGVAFFSWVALRKK